MIITPKGQWKLFVLATLIEACLLVLWLQNDVYWAKALYLSYNWTVHGAFILIVMALHVMALFGAPTAPPDPYRPPGLAKCKWLVGMTHLCLMFYIGQVPLAVTIIAAHVIGRVDSKLRKAP